jgi:transposase-like protein
MTITRKKYPAEFKLEAIRLAKERGNVAQTARDLGVGENTLQYWIRQSERMPDNPFPGNGNPHDTETAALKRELARVKEENEILKKLWVSSLFAPSEIPVHQRAWGAVPGLFSVPGHASIARRLLSVASSTSKPAGSRQ